MSIDNIKTILVDYKQRFINTRSNSKAYFVSKLSPSHSIDLVDYNSKYGQDNQEGLSVDYVSEMVFEKLEINAKQVLKFFDNTSSTELKKGFTTIKKMVPVFAETDYIYLISLKKKMEEADSDADNENAEQEKKVLKKEFRAELNTILDKCEKKLNREFNAITKLVRVAKARQKDFSKNDLYLGHPFIEGRFNTGKCFRAPLVLHRVETNISAANVKIKLIEGESILNPVFFAANILENELEHQKLDWGITDPNYLQIAFKTLESYHVNYEYESIPDKFYSCSKIEYLKDRFIPTNKFKVLSNVVIGLFPISDKNIQNDIDEICEQKDIATGELNNFFTSADRAEDIWGDTEDIRIKENDIKYVLPCDYSQKQVVKEAMDSSLVIEGPPGTGKSQVLANIAANYLDKGQRVLIVSQKAAALSVVYNRLGRISESALLLPDHINNKKDFYSKIKQTISCIKRVSNEDNSENINNISKDIERFFSILENRDEVYRSRYGNLDYKELVELDGVKIKHDYSKVNTASLLDSFATREEFDNQLNSIYEVYEKVVNSTFLDFVNADDYKEKLQFLIKCKKDRKAINQSAYLAFSNNKYSVLANYSKVCTKANHTYDYNELLLIMDSYIQEDSIKKFALHKVEIDKPAYKNISLTDEIKFLIEKWGMLKGKNKIKYIKQLSNSNFKKKFSLSKKCLDNQEKILYDNIDNSYIDLHPYNIIDFTDMEERECLAEAVYVSNTTDKDQIIYNLEQSGCISLDIQERKEDYEHFLEALETVNLADIDLLLSLDRKKVSLFIAFKADKVEDIGDYTNYLYKQMHQNSIEKIKPYLDFYTNIDKNYSDNKTKINRKVELSKLEIYNKARNQIREKAISFPEVKASVVELDRISTLKRQKSISLIIKQHIDSLMALFPIMLMSPGTVSACLPNIKGLFDVVIFDEASQMFIENAIPSIFRGSRLIIAGDSKQLKPSSVFSQRFVDDEVEEESYEVQAALEEESLLDFGKNKYKSRYLRYHYRSQYKELIEFSNKAFYENKLVFANANVAIQKKNLFPIEHVRVEGEWVDNSNIQEAEKVLEKVLNILETRTDNETIGIITFNINQKKLIETILEDSAMSNPELLKEMNRVNAEDGSDESLFVKNIENVQGDERDTIIFSVAYSKNTRGRFVNSFGSLSQPGGENRLNVAITRAKKKIYVVKSIDASIMSVNDNNRGPFLFKKYLQFVELLSQEMDTTELLNQVCDIQEPTKELKGFDSPFEVEVFDDLKKVLNPRYELRNQVKVGSFRIDLAIYDTEEDKFVLGIECDGAQYHSSKDAVERDFYRQEYLEGRGWVIERIWSTNWWADRKRVVDRIATKYSDYCSS